MALITKRHLARDALDVAHDLLGAEFRRGAVRLKITEVEAYRWPDSACHGCHGRTRRNKTIWGPPGRAYVYLCYGLHQLLNVVTLRDGVPNAVLIRACEPVAGLSVIRRRRGGKSGPVLLTGPGKVGAALDLGRRFDGHDLTQPGGLELHRGAPPAAVLRGPRIGIGYAEEQDLRAPWRLAAADTPWVSHRASLRSSALPLP